MPLLRRRIHPTRQWSRSFSHDLSSFLANLHPGILLTHIYSTDRPLLGLFQYRSFSLELSSPSSLSSSFTSSSPPNTIGLLHLSTMFSSFQVLQPSSSPSLPLSTSFSLQLGQKARNGLTCLATSLSTSLLLTSISTPICGALPSEQHGSS